MTIFRGSLMLGAAALLAVALSGRPGAAEEINVGVINPLTGTYAFGGVPLHHGTLLAIEQANASGILGGNTLKVIEGDTGSDKGQTITLVSRLAQSDNVLIILGPTTSLEATAAAPVANELEVPFFVNGSSKGTTKAGPWSLKVQSVGADIMPVLSQYAVDKLGVKKVALIFDRGNDGFVAQKDAFKAGLEAGGVEVVSEDGILATDTDFLAISTRLAGEDIDAFFMAVPSELGANILLQLRQAGVPPEVLMLGPSTFSSESFTRIAGDAAEGAIILSDYFAGNPSELNQAFVKAYTEKYGIPPDNWAGMGYALGSLAIKAIVEAGPTPTRLAVRDNLNALRDVPTVIGNGTWTMDDERNPFYGAVVLTVKDGQFQLAD